MAVNPFHSLASYSQFVAAMFVRPTVERSTVSVWSASPYSGVAEGEAVFRNGFRLRIREEIDFDAAHRSLPHSAALQVRLEAFPLGEVATQQLLPRKSRCAGG
jgi:hypothetical protein